MARLTREDGFTLMELMIVVAILAMIAAAILGVYQVSQAIYTRSASLEDAQLSARAGLDRMAIELRLAGAYVSGAVNSIDAITAASRTSITFRGDVNGDTLNSSGDEITVCSASSCSALGDPGYTSGTSLVVNRATGIDGTTNPFAANKYIYALTGPRREVGQIAAGYASGTTLTLAAGLTYNYPVGSIVRTVETVTYTFNDATHAIVAARNTITRNWDGTEPNLPDSVVVSNVTDLTLTYYRICLRGAAVCDTDADATCPFHPTALPVPVSAACLAKIPQYKSVLSGLEIQISLTTQGNDGSRRTMISRVRPRSLGVVQE